MRILIVAHGYPPTHSAGAERRAERQARWFASHGHQVAVVAVENLNSTADPRKENQDGIEVTRLSLDLHAADEGLVASYDPRGVRSVVAACIADHKPELVHVISGYLIGRPAMRAARDAGLPTVITLTEFFFLCWRLNLIQPTGRACSGPDTLEKCAVCWFEQQRRYKWLSLTAPALARVYWSMAIRRPVARDLTGRLDERRRKLLETLDWADAIISPSRVLEQTFARHGVPVAKFRFMRQGLSIPQPLPTRLARSSPDLRLGYLGQIKPHKGVDLVVSAVRQLVAEGVAISLDLWGAEHEDPDYVRRLKRSSVNCARIRWRGQYTGGQSWQVLAGLDAVVVPSRWVENSPNVILEAFAVGVPVVATNLGGMAELVIHESGGLLFEMNDVEGLKRQLRRMAEEPGLLERLAGTVPTIKTLDHEMQELTRLYQGVISSHQQLD